MTEEATHSQLGVREWRSPGRRPRHPKTPVQILGPAGQAFPAGKPQVGDICAQILTPQGSHTEAQDPLRAKMLCSP